MINTCVFKNYLVHPERSAKLCESQQKLAKFGQEERKKNLGQNNRRKICTGVTFPSEICFVVGGAITENVGGIR